MERGETLFFFVLAGFIFCAHLNKFLPDILEAECRESELYTATCRHGGNTVVTLITPVYCSAVFLLRSVFLLSLKNRLSSLDQVS